MVTIKDMDKREEVVVKREDLVDRLVAMIAASNAAKI